MTEQENVEKILKSEDVVAKMQEDGGNGYHYLDEKLLPCPFCGGSAYVCTHADVMFQNFWYSIRCFDCDVDAYDCKTAEESAEKWNKRVVQNDSMSKV